MRRAGVAGLLCLAVTIGVIIGYFLKDGSLKPLTLQASNIDAQITMIRDYPLIDFYFDSNEKWVIVNHCNLFTDKEGFKVIKNAKLIEHIKEGLYLETFPVGRGITPNGYLYIYKNDILIKSVPYLNYCNVNDQLENAFERISREDVEQLIKSKLPPAI